MFYDPRGNILSSGTGINQTGLDEVEDYTDGSVTISVNPNVPEIVIEEFVIKKADYIIVSLVKFHKLKLYAPTPKKICEW